MDYIKDLILIISFGLSIVNLFFTIMSSKSAITSSEVSLYDILLKSRASMQNLCLRELYNNEVQNESKRESENNQSFDAVFDAEIESYLNSFNLACGLYISGAINKDRFKKLYDSEILEISTNELFLNHLKKTSAYGNIKEVCKEWFQVKI